MKLKSKIIVFFSVVIFALSMVACDNEGTAEKIGKKVDKAFQTAKKKIDDATD